MSSSSSQKLSLGALTALVVGSMIGAGVFSLPATFGRATGVMGAIIAWCIAGGGMLMLAFIFQSLAQRKPDLDSGVFVYAKAGFGDYMGFISAFGFWIGSCVGNVFYFILIKTTLGAFFPIFGEGNTVVSVLVSSVILWSVHFMILRGISGAAVINMIATYAKIIPIVIFLIFVVLSFQAGIFADNFWGNMMSNVSVDMHALEAYGYVGHSAIIMEPSQPESLFSQVRSTMLATVFVFIGVEGASVYSRLAKRREDVGIATVLGFLGVLCLFVMITLLSYGIMSRADLAALRQPSIAGVLEHIVGPWGAIFISVGLIVSVLGAFLSWTLLMSEALFAAAKNGAFPVVFSRESEQKVPVAALWLTNSMVQGFLILTYFVAYAFTLALELTSALTLIPYFLVAAYAVKLAWTGETYENDAPARKKALIIAGIALFYAALMLYAGGVKYILLSAIIYAPGTLFFIAAHVEQKKPIFSNLMEKSVFAAIVIAAIMAIYSIYAGYIII